MSEQLFTPTKLKVGFNKREDTFDGVLAFLTYYDAQGKLRMEKSWTTWCNPKLGVKEFDNEPTSGFVLNKQVGGVKESYGRDVRQEKVRVYDPRGFEIEITVQNMLTILRDCACFPGKGLDGQFVYAWNRNSLVLLPVISEEFRQSSEFTGLQGQKLTDESMIPGATYLTKLQSELLYIGRFPYYFAACWNNHWEPKTRKNYLGPPPATDRKGFITRYVFWHTDKQGRSGFVYLNELKNLGACRSTHVSEQFAELVELYRKSPHGSPVIELVTRKYVPSATRSYSADDSHYWCRPLENGVFEEWENCYDYGRRETSATKLQGSLNKGTWTLENGVLVHRPGKGYMLAPGTSRRGYEQWELVDWFSPQDLGLYAKLESGRTVRLAYSKFNKEYVFKG